MSYFTADELASITANPSAVGALYGNRYLQFSADLGGADQGRSLSSALLPVAFASMLSFSLKPYGNETSAQDLPGLMAEPDWACNDYVLVALYLADLLGYPGRSVQACGWNGGAVGNHCQMFAVDTASGDSIMCDPTIGLVVHGASFNSVLQGKPVNAGKMVSMLDAYGGSAPAVAYSPTVKTALLNGAYRPSDLMYYCTSKEKMIGLPSS